MGCGDSRVELFEGKRNDSLTKDTESTWITSTDGETTVSYTYTAGEEFELNGDSSFPTPGSPGTSAAQVNRAQADFKMETTHNTSAGGISSYTQRRRKNKDFVMNANPKAKTTVECLIEEKVQKFLATYGSDSTTDQDGISMNAPLTRFSNKHVTIASPISVRQSGKGKRKPYTTEGSP